MPTIQVNGTELYFREAGTGDSLLLIHGVGFNADIWGNVFEQLGQHYRTIAYDRRGYQRSQQGISLMKSYSGQEADDVIGLIRALSATPAILFGWSAGGIYALKAALKAPDCVKGLILYEPPIYLVQQMDFPTFRHFIKLMFLKTIGQKRAAATVFLRMILAYRDGRNSLDNLGPDFQAKLDKNTDMLLLDFLESAKDQPIPQTLGALTGFPVTVLIGDQSTALLQRTSQNAARLLHDASVVWLPNANHLAHIDQPDQFVQAITRST